jgi:hypothetical protein
MRPDFHWNKPPIAAIGHRSLGRLLRAAILAERYFWSEPWEMLSENN